LTGYASFSPASGFRSLRCGLGTQRSPRRGSQEGDDALIQVSLVAAALDIFAPEYEKCIPVAGSYLFRVDFDYR
jgi:hypothetical protein